MIKFFRHIRKSLLMDNKTLIVIPTERSDEESHNEISQSKPCFSFRNDKTIKPMIKSLKQKTQHFCIGFCHSCKGRYPFMFYNSLYEMLKQSRPDNYRELSGQHDKQFAMGVA